MLTLKLKTTTRVKNIKISSVTQKWIKNKALKFTAEMYCRRLPILFITGV